MSMLNRFIVTTGAVLAIFTFSTALHAQRAAQSKDLAEELAKRQWNNSPPTKGPMQTGRRARLRSVIFPGSGTERLRVVEATGPHEYPAGDNGSKIAGRDDESTVAKQLPYTAAGLAALRKQTRGRCTVRWTSPYPTTR